MVTVAVAVLLLVLFEGTAVKRAAERQDAGWQRTVMMAVGTPVGWVAQKLPFSGFGDRFNYVIGGGAIEAAEPVTTHDRRASSGAVPVGAFDPRELGAQATPLGRLRTLLVTGDSMAMPLDAETARMFAARGVRTTRDPHIGTGISKPEIVDWVRLAGRQATAGTDATVVFLGANEGFPLQTDGREALCCGPEWTAAYATSVRRMMTSYARDGRARVYWLLLPLPRSPERRQVARSVNAAVRVAAGELRAYVRVVDLEQVFTPDGRYRDTTTIDGRETVVRESDGIHLNSAGARHAATIVRAAIDRDFGATSGR